MSSFVWPRLPLVPARLEMERLLKLDAGALRVTASTSHPDAAPVAVGGPVVAEATILSVQTQIRGLADRLGFPAELSQVTVSEFDRPATRILHDGMRIIPADAASEDVWSFLTLIVLPDVAVWRFPGRAEARLLGRPRNVFRKLWWRGETVGAEFIDVPGGLGEDELVNIMERPSLSANPTVARSLARAIHKQGLKTEIARSKLMRDVSKRVLRLQSVVLMESLAEAQIDQAVDECLAASLQSRGSRRYAPRV